MQPVDTTAIEMLTKALLQWHSAQGFPDALQIGALESAYPQHRAAANGLVPQGSSPPPHHSRNAGRAGSIELGLDPEPPRKHPARFASADQAMDAWWEAGGHRRLILTAPAPAPTAPAAGWVPPPPTGAFSQAPAAPAGSNHSAAAAAAAAGLLPPADGACPPAAGWGVPPGQYPLLRVVRDGSAGSAGSAAARGTGGSLGSPAAAAALRGPRLPVAPPPQPWISAPACVRGAGDGGVVVRRPVPWRPVAATGV
jgi:hypothetical protein